MRSKVSRSGTLIGEMPEISQPLRGLGPVMVTRNDLLVGE